MENHTDYNRRYLSKNQYWDFKPSGMALKALSLMPPLERRPKVLEIGCGEGGTAVFLARNGYDVTAFDLSEVGLEKTRRQAELAGVEIKTFKANVNDYVPDETFDLVFSSGTLQYLRPERREPFIRSIQAHTSDGGLHILHTFVSKPFVDIAPDAESHEHLWTSGELLSLYGAWMTEDFVEEIKSCNSSGIPHRHAHNRLWSRKIKASV